MHLRKRLRLYHKIRGELYRLAYGLNDFLFWKQSLIESLPRVQAAIVKLADNKRYIESKISAKDNNHKMKKQSHNAG